MNQPIVGKVAAIIDERTVVINRGKEHGVSDGMTFQIRLLIPEIKDPDDPTRKLSGLSYVKAALEIRGTHTGFAFGRLMPRVGRSAFRGALVSREPLPSIDGLPLLSEYDWQIRVGDTATQVIEAPETEKKESTKDSSGG